MMAIEYGNKDSMNELGFYYDKVEHDIKMMKKYYMMGVKLRYAPCMNNMGRYYQNISDDSNMMIFYKLAAKYGSKMAVQNIKKYNRLKNSLNESDI
jgi:hypothetical protein